MRKFYLFFTCLMLAALANAQTLQGNASTLPSSLPGSIDYQLTPAATFQTGAFWNNTQINLANNFAVSAELNFGTNSAGVPGEFFSTGADGIAFVLQSVGTSALGTTGEGIGYGGVTNSFAVEMDTWENTNRNDPAEDHLAFMKNGDVTHGTAANSNADRYLLSDLEDGAWHPISIAWNAATQTMTVTLDGTARTYTGNVAGIIGTNMVTWGFTAATGAAINQHRIRFAPEPNCEPFTVSTSLPPLGCSTGNTLYIGYGPQSITAVPSSTGPATTYVWYKVGTPNTQVGTGATFTPTTAGSYYVVATRGTCTATTMGNPTQMITVVDIRCGKNNQNKVYVCHKQNGTHGNGTIGENSHSLCIDPSAVPAHLAHGDCLGACETASGRSNASNNGDASENTNVVYPNPTTGSVKINLPGEANGRSEIMIRNAQGKIVELKNVSGNAPQTFNLRKYGLGVFLIQVKSGSSISTNKVLVQE